MRGFISFHIERSEIFHNVRQYIISHSATPNISLNSTVAFLYYEPKSPECVSIRDFTFSLFTLRFSLPPDGHRPSDRLLRKLSPVLSGPSRVSHSFGSCSCLALLALCRTPLVKTCHRHLFTALTQQGEPKNPSRETWIFLFVPKAQHRLTEGQHHFRAKSCFATSREHHCRPRHK